MQYSTKMQQACAAYQGISQLINSLQDSSLRARAMKHFSDIGGTLFSFTVNEEPYQLICVSSNPTEPQFGGVDIKLVSPSGVSTTVGGGAASQPVTFEDLSFKIGENTYSFEDIVSMSEKSIGSHALVACALKLTMQGRFSEDVLHTFVAQAGEDAVEIHAPLERTICDTLGGASKEDAFDQLFKLIEGSYTQVISAVNGKNSLPFDWTVIDYSYKGFVGAVIADVAVVTITAAATVLLGMLHPVLAVVGATIISIGSFIISQTSENVLTTPKWDPWASTPAINLRVGRGLYSLDTLPVWLAENLQEYGVAQVVTKNFVYNCFMHDDSGEIVAVEIYPACITPPLGDFEKPVVGKVYQYYAGQYPSYATTGDWRSMTIGQGFSYSFFKGFGYYNADDLGPTLSKDFPLSYQALACCRYALWHSAVHAAAQGDLNNVQPSKTSSSIASTFAQIMVDSIRDGEDAVYFIEKNLDWLNWAKIKDTMSRLDDINSDTANRLVGDLSLHGSDSTIDPVLYVTPYIPNRSSFTVKAPTHSQSAWINTAAVSALCLAAVGLAVYAGAKIRSKLSKNSMRRSLNVEAARAAYLKDPTQSNFDAYYKSYTKQRRLAKIRSAFTLNPESGPMTDADLSAQDDTLRRLDALLRIITG